MKASRRSVEFGSARIEYELEYRPRRDLAISVHPDLSVSVVCSPGRSVEEVDAAVRRKAPWIIRHRLRYTELHPLPGVKRFIPGETHRYLGRQFRLRVEHGEARIVIISRPFLVVQVRHSDGSEVVQRIVADWYRLQAKRVLDQQVQLVLERHPHLATKGTRFCVRRMARRWGSCSPTGLITLNPELVRAPRACIEYVIVHELCHRKALNHGPRFRRLLARVLPDWRARKDRLDRLD